MELDWLNSKIAEETIELVFVFDEEGRILFANRTAAEKLEYKDGELLKCNMCHIFRQDFPEEKEGDRVFDRGKLEEKEETAAYRKNSSCFSVKIRIFPGTKEGVYLLLAEDVTGQKDVNARIRKLREDEEKNRKARNEFTANVTHELRTPLNGIKGHVTTLIEGNVNAEQRNTLDLILYCCDNMSAIINNILDFAKLETGKFTIDEEEFDFYKMMDRVIATHSAEINKKELRLSVSMDEKIPRFVIGDELRLVQVLNNLLSNAVKFTLMGYVSIVVSQTMRVNDEIELFFMVKDSGIGISPKEQDKLFQSFSQADASITRNFGGTGLGLVITKQLVELMHGDIHVESEKGKGSTFSFSVRVKTNQNVGELHSQVYETWADFIREENRWSEENISGEEEVDSRAELSKRLDKLAMSIEMGAWDKAETLASTVKALAGREDENLKRLVLRMEMAIRKSNYEKSIEAFGKVRQVLEEQMNR
ncbi:MAG: ATP-binding protein [Roseburia sp.]|nr:ATP-binding protein [Roseburia sp.]